MRGDFGSFSGGASNPTALSDLLMPLVEGRWGRSEMTIALHDLTAAGDDADLGSGELSLGQLEWRIGADGRRDFADLSTRISAVDVVLGGAAAAEIPPALVPQAATLDIAFSRLPLRRIADSLSGLANRGEMGGPGEESMMVVILDHLDAADSSFEIREIHVVTPSCELRAAGRLQVEPASVFGVIGRIEALIRGFDSLMELALMRRCLSICEVGYALRFLRLFPVERIVLFLTGSEHSWQRSRGCAHTQLLSGWLPAPIRQLTIPQSRFLRAQCSGGGGAHL